MDFWVILYSLICIMIGGGGVTFLYKRGQTIAAMILLILLILIFIFYGLRWFPDGNLNGTKPPAKAWPPIVNMCPDFMVSWKDLDTGKLYCYDANNVYGLQTALSSPPLAGNLIINRRVGQSAYLIKDPSQGAKPPATLAADIATAPYFPLAKKLTDSSSDVLTTTAKYLRWEGVWDGHTLNSTRIPLPV